MYLLLIDHNLITSSELKEIIEQAPADTDIINCFSEETLLKVADKLNPDFVIIDFDLVKGNLAGLFRALREKSKRAYVMALISSEHYEPLSAAIETGGVDDYMVKPIQKEDLSARIRIASSKIEKAGHDDQESPGFAEAEPYVDDTGLADEAEDLTEDDDAFGPSREISGADYPHIVDEEQPQEADLSEEPGAGEPITRDSDPDLFDLESGPSEESEKTDEEKDLFDDLDLFTDESEEEQFETGGDSEPGPAFDFDDTPPAGEEKSGGQDFFDEEPQPETESFGPAFFDDTAESEQDHDLKDDSLEEDEQEDLRKLFDDVDSMFDTEEEGAKEVPGPEQEKEPFPEDDPFFDQEEADAEPDPGADRPSDEFLEKPGPRDKRKPAHPLAEDKQFFDDLFDDEADPGVIDKQEQPGKADQQAAARPRTQKSRDSFHSEFPDFDEDDFDEDDDEEYPGGGPRLSREEIRRKSNLPGKSADEFLFGEDEDDSDPGEPEFDDQDYQSDMDDPFADEQDDFDYPRKKKKSRGRFKGFFSIFGNVVFVVLLLVMAGLSFFLIQSRVTGGVPQVAGYQMYIVLSGSMSPEFDTGSLVFVREKEPEQLVVGDIITFRSINDPDSLTTHRIVEVQRDDGLRFITRGDANNVNDPNPVPADNVVGLVTGDVPYVGYLLNFVQTPQGLVLLIFVPGVLIILFELNKIVRYLTQGNNGKKNKRDNDYRRLAEEEY